MRSTTPPELSTQVYRIEIRATPEQIWAAITRPEFTARYFHGSRITVTAKRRRSLAPDGSVRGDDGVCTLTVTHDLLEASPRTAHEVSGEGWMGVLRGLRAVVEDAG